MKIIYILIIIIIISILYNCYIIENFDYNKYKIKIYYFNTSWCKWSKQFNPEWNKFVNMIDTSLYESINIQCDKIENGTLCAVYNVPGFPHIVIETYNKKIIYTGERSANALINFLKTLSNSS
jgi:hypothetical protein